MKAPIGVIVGFPVEPKAAGSGIRQCPSFGMLSAGRFSFGKCRMIPFRKIPASGSPGAGSDHFAQSLGRRLLPEACSDWNLARSSVDEHRSQGVREGEIEMD